MDKRTVTCPGSCGELFQGVFEGQECLLSYGIDRRTCLTLDPEGNFPQKEKMKRALDLLTYGCDLRFSYQSDLPVGKGCSSSTADMLACLYLASLEQKKYLSPQDLTCLCAQIEPTDSVAFRDWTVINPLTGEILFETSWKPELYVYMLEPDHALRTLGLVRMTDSPLYPKEESSRLFPLFQEACEKQSLEKLGKVATYSAILNNQRLPKPYLDDLLDLCKFYRLVGLNVAHSGTVVGLLLTREQLGRLGDLEHALSQSPLSSYYQKRRLTKIVYEGLQQRK